MKKLLILLTLLSVQLFGKEKLTDFSVVLDWYPNAKHIFMYVAEEKGYFKEEGINLILHYPANVSDGITLPAAKKANIGMYYQQKLIQAKASDDIPVVSIATITQGPLDVVMALKEMNIKRPKDLEGKKIGHIGGVVAEEILKTIIIEDGGDISQVELIDVGFELLSSTITKRVDATFGAVYNHEVPVMEEKGMPVDYFLATEYGVPNYYETILIANKDLVKKEKALYEGFLRASKKGFEYSKKHPEEALNILLANQEADQFPLQKSIEEKSLKILIEVMEKNGKFMTQDKKSWEENVDWMYDKGIIKKKVNVKDLVVDI